MNVRTAARRRQAKRLRHAAAARRAFYARGERGWQQYRRTVEARTVDQVFNAIDARVAARRREIQWSVGAELARGASSVTFPQAREPEDWEPPRFEFKLKPADFDDDGQP